MHLSSFENAQRFRDTYCMNHVGSIAEIGSQQIGDEASMRVLFEGCDHYIGFDFANGKGVDIILDDPYHLRAEDESFDRVLSSSCFEHSEFFWLSFLEMVRICKSGGLIYLQAPSNGKFHRHPVDCWRFYPDSGVALQNWARRNDLEVTLLESFTTYQKSDCWNDFVAVFQKGNTDKFPLPTSRITQSFDQFKNAVIYGQPKIIHHSELTEDMARLAVSASVSNGSIQINW